MDEASTESTIAVANVQSIHVAVVEENGKTNNDAEKEIKVMNTNNLVCIISWAAGLESKVARS